MLRLNTRENADRSWIARKRSVRNAECRRVLTLVSRVLHYDQERAWRMRIGKERLRTRERMDVVNTAGKLSISDHVLSIGVYKHVEREEKEGCMPQKEMQRR